MILDGKVLCVWSRYVCKSWILGERFRRLKSYDERKPLSYIPPGAKSYKNYLQEYISHTKIKRLHCYTHDESCQYFKMFRE